jgi:hypothetical protein
MKVPQVTMGLNTKMVIHDLNQHGTVTRYHVLRSRARLRSGAPSLRMARNGSLPTAVDEPQTDSSVVHFVNG